MMAGNLLGLLIGAEMAEEDGGSPISGALEGYVAESLFRSVAPIVMTLAVGWTVRHLARRGYRALSKAVD